MKGPTPNAEAPFGGSGVSHLRALYRYGTARLLHQDLIREDLGLRSLHPLIFSDRIQVCSDRTIHSVEDTLWQITSAIY